MRRNLTKKEKIKRGVEIQHLFSSSYRVRCHGIQLRYAKNNLDYNRFMICLVRKFGNAVERNRAKRIFKEIYRLNKDCIRTGYNLAFILLPGEYEYKERKKQFQKIIKKAELFFYNE